MDNKDNQIIFGKICEPDMKDIWKYLSMEKGRTTDFSYGGILMWVDYFNYEFAIYRDTLFIKGVLENNREVPAFSMPIGKMSLKESIEVLQNYCANRDIPLRFSAVPEYAISDFVDLGFDKIENLETWGDYLYDIESLATLRGKKMAKKRNHVNQFENAYPGWVYERLNCGNAEDALELMDLIDLDYAANGNAAIERKLSRTMLDYMKNGDEILMGGVLKVDNKPVAFTVGDIKGDTLYVHIEKANRHYSGSYEMINKCFAADIFESFPYLKFINREDDGGDEGLRNAKTSYHPVEILRKFNVAMK